MTPVLCLLLLQISPLFALVALPRDDPTPSTPTPTPAPQYARRYLYDCDKGDKLIEASAWKDHLNVAKGALKWKPGKDYQNTFDTYMGPDSKNSPYKDAIRNAQEKQVKVHQSNWVFPDSWLYIYCREKDDKSPYDGKKNCDPGTYAYSFTVRGWFHNSYNIVFCKPYYDNKMLTDTIINNIKSGHKSPSDTTYMWNAYAQTYYHELMHFSIVNDTVYNGKMPDVIKPFEISSVARAHGCKGSWFYPRNGNRFWASSMYAPDAYSIAGTFSYIQQAAGIKDIPAPAATDDGFAENGTGTNPYPVLPDLDAHDSAAYNKANLQYDATKEDWSFAGLGLTDDNLPLWYPDSVVTEDEYNQLVSQTQDTDN